MKRAGILPVYESMAEEVRIEEAAKPVEQSHRKHDPAGIGLSVVIILVGIGLLLLTFYLAYRMFEIPADRVLGVQPDRPLELESAIRTFAGLIVRVLLLIVMAIVASVLTNRGIKLYTEARHR